MYVGIYIVLCVVTNFAFLIAVHSCQRVAAAAIVGHTKRNGVVRRMYKNNTKEKEQAASNNNALRSKTSTVWCLK